jgi:hypothetical protein
LKVPLSKSGVRKHRGFESHPLRHAARTRPAGLRADTPGERSPRGLGRRTGNAVWGNPSRVRIPPSPPPPLQGHRWPPRGARVALVVADSSTARDVVARHRSIFDSTFPSRTVAMRPWLESPTGDLLVPIGDLRGVWFFRATHTVRAMGGSSCRQRSRALHGSGRSAPEHGAGSPALGTRPPRLAIVRRTNWARISEERDARRAANRVMIARVPRRQRNRMRGPAPRADGVRHPVAQSRRPSRAPLL